jgi:hypothetical protein
MIRLLVKHLPEDAPVVLPLLKVTILLYISSQVATFDHLALGEIEVDPMNHHAFINAKLKNTLPWRAVPDASKISAQYIIPFEETWGKA